MTTMLIVVAFVLLVLNFTKCESQNEGNSNYNYTSLNGDKINIKDYCNARHCIAKCCRGETTFFTFIRETQTFECKDMKATQKDTRIEDFPLKIYQKEIKNEIALSNMTLKNFRFVNNDRFLVPNLYTEKPGDRNFYLLEDASLMIEAPNYYNRWVKHLHAPFDHCIDMVIVKTPTTTIKRLRYGRILEAETSGQSEEEAIFIAVAMLISSFFLVIVLIVYGLLPKLRNIVGMVLMAYVINLLVWFMMKATHTLADFTSATCKITSPIMYYTILASFFWLNIMSFDIWWTFRGTRKCRDIHRRGELVKFLWYSLYAWGTPLGVTIGIVLLDNSKVKAHIIKPHFSSCLYGAQENLLFIYTPIIILTMVNCVLFMLTVYNIWLIHRGMRKFNKKNSQKNKNNENRFGVYIKMSVLMGVSWILEIIQIFAGIKASWLFIVMNTYNAFLGVAIFFFFVFKKSILDMLCKSLMRQDDVETTHQGRTSVPTRRAIATSGRAALPFERSSSFSFTRGTNQLHLNNEFFTRMESKMGSRNTGTSDSSRKHASRAESESTEVTIELKDVNNMVEVSLIPQ